MKKIVVFLPIIILLFSPIFANSQIVNKAGKTLSINESIDIIVLFSSAMASSALMQLDPKLSKMIDDSKLNIGPLTLKLHGEVKSNYAKPPEDKISIILSNTWIPFSISDDKDKELIRISFRRGEFGFSKGALFIKEGTEAKIGDNLYKYSNNNWKKLIEK